MANIFLSYSSKEKKIIDQFASALMKHGYTVWWDKEIPIGQSYADVLERQLKESDCVVVLWTKRSVQSQWVKNEATIAERLNKIVPVMLEEVELPLAFMHIETALLHNDIKLGETVEFNLLIEAIERCIQKNKESRSGEEIKRNTTDDISSIPIQRFNAKSPFSLLKKYAWLVAVVAILSASIYYFTFNSKSTEKREIKINGKVQDSNQHGISGVELNVEGTPYFAMSEANGNYSLIYFDYNNLANVSVTTSHANYRDTSLTLPLIDKTTLELNFILSSLQINP